jgi:hypothetical protein
MRFKAYWICEIGIFPPNETISLDGQWEFYPSLFLNPNTVHTLSSDANGSLIQVPAKREMIMLDDKIAPIPMGLTACVF